MKKIKLLITIIIMVLLVVFIYQLFMLKKYKSEKRDIDLNTIYNETITIKRNNDNIDIDEYFDGFVDKENGSFKVKYDESNNIESYYSTSIKEQYINVLSINSFKLYTNTSNNNTNINTDNNTKKYLDKHNIKNDVDLLKYIKDNYYFNNNIITLTSDMNINYILNSFVELTRPDFNTITLINGDINGYIINNNVAKEIHIMKQEEQYIITLGGNVANKEFITNMLSTIKI